MLDSNDRRFIFIIGLIMLGSGIAMLSNAYGNPPGQLISLTFMSIGGVLVMLSVEKILKNDSSG